MKSQKSKKDLFICVPHSIARNLFSSSFDFKNTSLIFGNFSPRIRKYLKKKHLAK